MEFLHIPGGHHHQVCQFINYDDDIGQFLFCHLVIGGKTFDPLLLQQPVAALHLLDGPQQGPARHFRFNDHRMQQMGNVLIDRQLDPLGIDHEQPHLIRGCLEKDGGDNGIDGHPLPGPGGAGNEEMGHAGYIGNNRMADNVEAESQGQLRSGV